MKNVICILFLISCSVFGETQHKVMKLLLPSGQPAKNMKAKISVISGGLEAPTAEKTKRWLLTTNDKGVLTLNKEILRLLETQNKQYFVMRRILVDVGGYNLHLGSYKDELQLVKNTPIVGTVKLPNGKPAKGAKVWLEEIAAYFYVKGRKAWS